jgi:hypothetical protein
MSLTSFHEVDANAPPTGLLIRKVPVKEQLDLPGSYQLENPLYPEGSGLLGRRRKD